MELYNIWSSVYGFFFFFLLRFIHVVACVFLFYGWIIVHYRDVPHLCLQCRKPGFSPWIRKIPWRREWQPTPVFLPGKFHGQRSPAGCSPWGQKESDMTEWLIMFIFFIQSSADGYLDCFYLLAIVNNAAMNPCGQVYVWHMFLFRLGIYLRVELLSHMVTQCLTLWGTARPFSRMAEPFYIPTSNIWGLLFSAHPPQHLVFLLFYYNHINWHEVVSH